MGRKRRKDKPVNHELVPKGHAAYDLLKQARDQWHQVLKAAKIALVWRSRVKPDRDSHVMLGKCVKATELAKEFSEFDFVIVLNLDHWHILTDPQRLALLDHELCHAAPDVDQRTMEQRKDDRGRLCWRIRKHDIEEFRDVVSRHGCYKRELEEFVRAARTKPGLFDKPKDAKASA